MVRYTAGTESLGTPMQVVQIDVLNGIIVLDKPAGISSARAGISCSIDPTPEGIQQLRAHASRLKTIGDPQVTAAGIEQALGRQQVTFTGVPATSHFAGVLVAADYRMKRLGMGLDPSPVAQMPSYLQLMKAGGRGMQVTRFGRSRHRSKDSQR